MANQLTSDRPTAPATFPNAPRLYRPGASYMVGDGFDVRNLFPSNEIGSQVSPFLLLDYAGPTDYAPTERPRGVDEHPHRGFETVTIVYQGDLEHRDSAGNAGTIGAGDVQWMTAGSGVVHEEKHERGFARCGGTLEAIQLWVNLPRAVKMTPPRYQTLRKAHIPTVPLEQGAGDVRVIAGRFRGVPGPAATFTPVHVYDLRLTEGHRTALAVPNGYNTAVFLLHGRLVLNGMPMQAAELAVLDQRGAALDLETLGDSTVLVLMGDPIDEPVVWGGPFVMTTQAEVIQARDDYRRGKMGHL